MGVLVSKGKAKRCKAHEIRDAADVHGTASLLPRCTGDSVVVVVVVVLVVVVVVVVGIVDVEGGGDQVEFQEALCSRSTLPKQCDLTPSRSLPSHMLLALITMDLWYPLLPPEHLALTLMAIWQSSLPTTLSDLIRSDLARVMSDNCSRLRVFCVPLIECHSPCDLLKMYFLAFHLLQ